MLPRECIKEELNLDFRAKEKLKRYAFSSVTLKLRSIGHLIGRTRAMTGTGARAAEPS
jgi:hypothetical protein